jgi:hypothetical protein
VSGIIHGRKVHSYAMLDVVTTEPRAPDLQ